MDMGMLEVPMLVFVVGIRVKGRWSLMGTAVYHETMLCLQYGLASH